MSEKRYTVRETHDSYDVIDTATDVEVCSTNTGGEMEVLVDLLNQQADEMEQLRSQNLKLREALEPFARLAANIGHLHDVFSLPFNNFVTDQDLQNASEALANLRSIGKAMK